VEPAVPGSAVSVLGSWMGPGRKSIAVESTSTPLVSAEQIDTARFMPTSLWVFKGSESHGGREHTGLMLSSQAWRSTVSSDI
jgi:hypothetical protein